MTLRRDLLALMAACLLLTGCSAPVLDDAPATPASPTTPTTEEATPDQVRDLGIALSDPVEDSVYPEAGEPGVDALLYSLNLTWDPDDDLLTGSQTLIFRATESAPSFQLDLGAPLEVSAALLDGLPVPFTHRGKDLVVDGDVLADERSVLDVEYAGTPEPVEAPTTRTDMPGLGFTIDDDHQVWTMQEPFGAYTWYAVNDQPADKALYEFTLNVPSPWTGIANGTQTSLIDDGTTTTTTYTLDEPAASYLVTLAFGDYVRTDDEGPGGVPITYWVPRGSENRLPNLQTTPAAMTFLEESLGPYPFETAGILVVDSDSGMETQTMITLGDNRYSTAPATIVHELAHHWYGNQVTPSDWSDVWMNEGMAMYFQLMWQAEDEGIALDPYLDGFRAYEAEQREAAGPPADYDPARFGEGNVYYSPALMWHALRELLGDETFFEIVRGWPLVRDNTSTDREAFLAYVEEGSGQDLDAFFDAWLLGETTPG